MSGVGFLPSTVSFCAPSFFGTAPVVFFTQKYIVSPHQHSQASKPSIAMQSSLIPSPPQNQHALQLMTKRLRAFNVTSISEADPRLDWKEDALHTPQVTRPPHQHGMMSWKLKASTQTDGPYENMDDFNVNVHFPGGCSHKRELKVDKIPHLPCQLVTISKLTPN